MRVLERHKQGLSTRTVLLLTLAGCAILLAPTILWDFGYDQGTFAYGGSALLRGEKPYLDFWDIKPPNIFYTYATAFLLFGESVRAIRVLDYLNALVIVALLFTLSTRLWNHTNWSRVAGVMTSLIFVIQYYILGGSDTAQAETYSLPWLLLSVLLVLPRATTRQEKVRMISPTAALAGLCISIAFFYKFPNGIFLILAGAVLWLNAGNNLKDHLRYLGAFAGGFVVGIGLQALYMAMQGELSVLYAITTNSTLKYTSNNYSGHFTLARNLRTSFQQLDLLWVVTAIIGWSLWGMEHSAEKHPDKLFRSAMLMALGVVLAFLSVQAQNKGYAYHYWILLPWMDILIGAGIAHLARTLRKLDTLPRGTNAFIVAIVLFIGSYLWTSRDRLQPAAYEFTQIASGKMAPRDYIASDELVQYVKSHSSTHDRLFIFGFEPYVYWKSDRRPATKYLNTIHFKPTYVDPKERATLIQQLTSNPPELFLVETEDHYTSQGDSFDDSRTTIQKRYPEIEALLASRYEVRDTIKDVIAYHLR